MVNNGLWCHTISANGFSYRDNLSDMKRAYLAYVHYVLIGSGPRQKGNHELWFGAIPVAGDKKRYKRKR